MGYGDDGYSRVLELVRSYHGEHKTFASLPGETVVLIDRAMQEVAPGLRLIGVRTVR